MLKKQSTLVRVVLGGALLLLASVLCAVAYLAHYVYIADAKPTGEFIKQANALVSAHSPTAVKQGTDLLAVTTPIAEALWNLRRERTASASGERQTIEEYEAAEREIFLALAQDGSIAKLRSLKEFADAALQASSEKPLASFKEFRSLSVCMQLLLQDFEHAAQENDVSRAGDALAASLVIAKVLTRSPYDANRLSGLSQMGPLQALINELIESDSFSPAIATQVRDQLIAYKLPLSIEQLIELDRLRAMSSADDMYEPGPRGRIIPSRELFVLTGGQFPAKRTWRDVQQLQRPRRAAAEQSIASIAAYGSALAKLPLASPQRSQVAAPVATFSNWGSPIIEVTFVYAEGAEARRSASILIAALALHRHRTGSYPATLNDLLGTELASLPTNISAPGGAWIYKLDRESNRVVLATAGPSGIDNACEQAPEGTKFPYRHSAITDFNASERFDYVFFSAPLP